MREQQKALFNSLRPRLLRACAAYLGEQHAEAADIVQDLYRLAMPRLDLEAPVERNIVWLKQLCLQLCGERRRSREGLVRCLEVELQRARESLEVEPVESDNLEVQKHQWVALLREAIKPLSLQGRQMLQLRNVKGLTYAQIASTLELSWADVAERLAAAQEEMRSSLGTDPEEPVPSTLTRGPWTAETR